MINSSVKGFHPQTWAEASAQLSKTNKSYVLVTLLGSAGSTPRAAGTKMVISKDDIFDTIGGGHLEFNIIEKARLLLSQGEATQNIEHFPLGASLGQCCGGSISVLFETLVNRKMKVDIYGAGHVSHALISILSQLPLQVRWIDSRAELFPEVVPNNVNCIVDEFPQDQVKNAPANSVYIVLTHNHQLDFSLAEVVIKREDSKFLGVIGSATKATRFRMRLQHKGFSELAINKMKCPVGLAEVGGKLPMEVAVSISAELINLYQADQTEPNIRSGLQWRDLKAEVPELVLKEITKV